MFKRMQACSMKSNLQLGLSSAISVMDHCIDSQCAGEKAMPNISDNIDQ